MQRSKSSKPVSRTNDIGAATPDEKLARVQAAVKRIQKALKTRSPSGLKKERSRDVLAAGRLALNRAAIAREAGMSKNDLYNIPIINTYLTDLLTPAPPEFDTLTDQFTAQLIDRDKNLKVASIVIARAMETWDANDAELVASTKRKAERTKAAAAHRRESTNANDRDET